MKTALLLIDIQNDYFLGGKMELVNMEHAAQNARQILMHCREQQFPIFHIQHLSIRPNATFFIPNTQGAEINPLVAPDSLEPLIIKHYPNSFRETTLEKQLKEHHIQRLIICGAMSHMCIDTTTRAAFDLGYKCVVVADACATKDLSIQNVHVPAQQVHAAFMASLQGIFAEVTTSTQLEVLGTG